MSALLVLVFATGLGLADLQDPAGRQQAPTGTPAPAQIGDEPGVLTGHGPVRHTPVPGVRFRTVAPGGQNDGPAERRLGGDPPIPFPTLGGSTGGGTTIPPGTPGSGGTIVRSSGDDAGVAGGVRPPRPPR